MVLGDVPVPSDVHANSVEMVLGSWQLALEWLQQVYHVVCSGAKSSEKLRHLILYWHHELSFNCGSLLADLISCED